jgi:hypothetical protein
VLQPDITMGYFLEKIRESPIVKSRDSLENSFMVPERGLEPRIPVAYI